MLTIKIERSEPDDNAIIDCLYQIMESIQRGYRYGLGWELYEVEDNTKLKNEKEKSN